jgi:hypothetical protein
VVSVTRQTKDATGGSLRHGDGRLLCEVARGDRLTLGCAKHALREIASRHPIAHAKRRHLVLLGGEPIPLRVAEDVVENHDFARDERRTGVSAIAIVALPQGSVDPAGLKVMDQPAIRPLRESLGQPRATSVSRKSQTFLPSRTPAKALY